MPVSRSLCRARGCARRLSAIARAVRRRLRGFTTIISCCCLSVTVLLYTVATLGLNIQFGYAGVLNFAGASFFGIGAYTSAVLNTTLRFRICSCC